MFIFNCFCLFLPFAYSPLAYSHCMTLLTFLWMTLTLSVSIAWSSHHIPSSQLGSTSHHGDTKSSFARDAGVLVSHTHDAHLCPISPYHQWPNSMLNLQKHSQCSPGSTGEGEQGWGGIFLALLPHEDTSCPPPPREPWLWSRLSPRHQPHSPNEAWCYNYSFPLWFALSCQALPLPSSSHQPLPAQHTLLHTSSSGTRG